MIPLPARTLHALAAAIAVACAAAAGAQVSEGPVTGETLGGFVLPTEPGKWDVSLRSVSANLWKVGSTQRLLLRERVSVGLGSYDFTADSAVLWIERIPSAKGTITQLAVWFPETIEPTKAAGLGAAGSNLFVTASTYGEVKLNAVLVEPVAPAPGPDLERAQRRLAAYLEDLAADPPALRILPEVLRPPPPPEPPPLAVGGTAPADPSVLAAVRRGGSAESVREADALPAAGERPEVPGEEIAPDASRPIISPRSTVAFAAESIELESATDSITLTKGAAVDVLPRIGGGGERALQLRADRGVIFLRKGTLEGLKAGATEMQAESIEGVYLEGEVYATDFQYSVRARRAYYDFAANRATMVDGVLRTQDRRGIPVIARAAELRQYSQRQFEANQARVSMSEFFQPHLSIGADRAVITEVIQADGTTANQVTATDVTFRAGSVPFFWLPSFEATGEIMPPISRVSANYNDQTGAQINTRWRLFSLLGMAPPPQTDLDLVEEAATNWGVGGGLRGTLYGTRVDMLGIYDFGNAEQTSAGQFVTASDTFRGYARAERTFEFSETAKLDLRGSYVSDASFLQTWRQAEFATDPQRETSAYLVDAGDRSEVSLLLAVPTNGVITNSSQLASRPYQVRKYPEFAYKRWGDTLFGDSIAWQQEYSANLMAIEYGSGSATSTGVIPNAIYLNNPTQPAYSPGTGIETIYQDAGYRDDTYARLYTRQELSTTFGTGGLKFTPFTSGTAVGYVDGNPGDYDAAADRFRAILAAGFRSSADVMTSFDRFEVPTLDLHRLRHVLTPYVNTWAGWNTVQDLAYAVYDQEIEGATGGAAVQAGVRQRLQTMRGGPGNWQSVDWVTLDLGVMWNDSGDDLARTYESGARYGQSPFPQYFAWRPELSQWGRNAFAAFTMAASSTLTFRGNLTYLLDSSLPDLGDGAFGLQNAARGSFGASMQHAPDVSTFLEYRGINNFAPDADYISDSLLAGGVNYRISKTYSASFVPTYDLKENDFRLFTMNIAREMPDMTLFATFGYDAIQDQYFGGLNVAIGGLGATPTFGSQAINR